MKFTRIWAMPSSDTFDCYPIGAFVKKYLRESIISIDPFARNKRWCTYTNDLNPDTAAEYHLEAEDFLGKLKNENVKADLVILDPPYSPRQIAEVYQGIGRSVTMQDTQIAAMYSRVRKLIYPLVNVGGVVLSFGWNSQGMTGNDWDILEILLVCHGGAHNDTICMAEKKTAHQDKLL